MPPQRHNLMPLQAMEKPVHPNQQAGAMLRIARLQSFQAGTRLSAGGEMTPNTDFQSLSKHYMASGARQREWLGRCLPVHSQIATSPARGHVSGPSQQLRASSFSQRDIPSLSPNSYQKVGRLQIWQLVLPEPLNCPRSSMVRHQQDYKRQA